VFVHGEYWNARADGDVDAGERVEVIGFDGMVLKVRRRAN
jgi:membrane protein implicated in regulation of membrane protease activity